MNHDERIVDLRARFAEAMARFRARVAGAAPQALTRVPGAGQWSVAQIAWHVGATTTAFAGLIDGSIPNAKPPAAGYVEVPWPSIAAKVPQKLDADARFHPPAHVTRDDAVATLAASGDRLDRALADLTRERAGWTVPTILGLITLYQVGDWATAHVIRHNQQAKRLLGT